MEFRSDPKWSRLAGLAAGYVGITTLGMAVPAWEHGIGWVLVVGGLLLLLLSALAFTARREALIEPARDAVALVTRTLGWKREEHHALSSFRGVGIVTGGTGVDEGATEVTYQVQLIGPRNLSLPGVGTDREAALARARELADRTGLLLDETPAVGFAGHRL